MMSRDWNEHTASSEPQSLTSVVDRMVPTLIVFLGIGLLLLGYSMFWIVFVVGFSAVLPAARTAAQWYDSNHRTQTQSRSSPTRPDEDHAINTLRERYARGEIGEAEFEKQVERLLETETVADGRPNDSGSGSNRSNRRDSTEEARQRNRN
ncbi:SHOCT domain-containing protein [Haladaptatus cibarius]|uniref:SHOCT domain-containing protein n=1 Tax=Haladaptatus cibarius TaxID=453847 RepID=UPI0006790318|nr:SHOCT domain-containing protein [Haladaptatus cibarius]